MKILYEGTEYDFDFAKITVKQGVKIEKHTGMTLTEWGDQMQSGASMLALQAIGWLILHGGKTVPIEDTDFEVQALGEAMTAAMAEEEAAAKAAEPLAAEADPTPLPASASGSLMPLPQDHRSSPTA